MGNLNCDCCHLRDKEPTTTDAPRFASPSATPRGPSPCTTPRGNLIRDFGKASIDTLYDVGWSDILGTGTFGKIFKGTHKTTCAPRAIKSIVKSKMESARAGSRIREEIVIMKLMDHPNIIKLFETLEDADRIYLAMELCSGGDLLDRIDSRCPDHFITEVDATLIMRQILRAVAYIHGRYIIHRDLKPENFIFASADSIEGLKMIDFGVSRVCDPQETLRTQAGTPMYMAPELLGRSYNLPADLWSTGVLTYILLSGCPPFSGRTDQEICRKAKSGRFTFYYPEWTAISKDAKDFIKKLLTKDTRKRYTAVDALDDVWIKQKGRKASCNALLYPRKSFLRNFRAHSKFKQAVLYVIARQLDHSKLRHLTRVFEKLDANSDGLLSPQDIHNRIVEAGNDQILSDLRPIFQDVDNDNGSLINYTEFIAASLDTKQYMQKDVCWAAFHLFDKDGDGKITPQDIIEILNADEEVIQADTMNDLMLEIDTDGDGVIDFNDFLVMMRSTQDEEDASTPWTVSTSEGASRAETELAPAVMQKGAAVTEGIVGPSMPTARSEDEILFAGGEACEADSEAGTDATNSQLDDPQAKSDEKCEADLEAITDATTSQLGEPQAKRNEKCDADSEVVTDATISQLDDPLAKPDEKLDNDHVAMLGKGASSRWQTVRASVISANAADSLLGDVRAKHTENLYDDTDWTISRSASEVCNFRARLFTTKSHTSSSDGGSFDALKKVETYDRDWTLSHTESKGAAPDEAF